jgi:hypothetical protein
MHVTFKKRKTGEIEYGIIYGGVFLIALFIARTMPVLPLAPSCVFRELTGIPCPTCGATRSVVDLAQGEVFAAFRMNPLIALCFFNAILVFFYSLITLAFDLPKLNMILSSKEVNSVRVGAIVLILAQWIYLIATL